jgi:hypothetical protein
MGPRRRRLAAAGEALARFVSGLGTCIARAAVGALFVASASRAAQNASGAPQVAAPPTGAAQVAVDAARRALERGAELEAARHAQAALAIDSANLEAFAVLLRACGGDEDARTLWRHEFAAAVADAQGQYKLERELAALAATKDPRVAALAGARAAALEELLEASARWRKEAEKDGERALAAAWAARLAREVASASPALAARAAVDAPLGVPLSADAQKVALDSLARKLASVQAAGDTASAVELALVLRGLGAQSRFDDLEGPPPPPRLGPLLDNAEDALARARTALARSSQPLTVEQLEALDAEQRDEFTRAHASASSPGVALSPQGWYRLETICGHATLLGAAQVVELHHTRLANWYGTDPFKGRQGVVRIVPESHGLESEGSPFWWAGGFQSGDLTTLRFACSTIADLGRGLTHELTHRFDGAVHPGIPSWLAEGRAVWTAAAYGMDHDTEFVREHALFGTIDDARFRGYGARENLEKLVRGTIDDYRDNYVAGYALFVFLSSWGDEGAPPKYAEALAKYQRSRRTDKRAAFEAFVSHFCDGAGGRPKDFDAFTAEFSEWVHGFYWRDRKPFTKRYVESAGPAEAGVSVLDEPTWVWSRARAEPWFGQDQAREGARLLERLGDERGATAAYLWSLAVDEPSSRVELALAALLEKASKREGAWIARHTSQLRDDEDAAPTLSPLLSKLPRTRAWLDGLAAASQEAAKGSAPLTAAALAADHDRVARLVGAPRFAASLAAPRLGGRAHPFDPPARNPMRDGWVEDGLTDFERHRVPGLWFLDEREHLHVGRNKPRTASGSADRAAHLHHVFVRAGRPLEAGSYSIRARITPTTSYVSGALVLGYTRRDRNLRVHFSGGDYEYAIGDKEEAAELTAIGWRVDGAFERDNGLGGSLRSGEYGFGQTSSSFTLEVRVDGAQAQVFIEGERVGVYHTPTAVDVAGHFGFAVSMGDFRVSELAVRRLDRSAAFARGATPDAQLDPAVRSGLEFGEWDLALPRRVAFTETLNRAVRGVPRHARGALVLCVADPDPNSAEAGERALERVAEFEAFRERYGLDMPAYVALAGALGDEVLTRARAALSPGGEPASVPPAQVLVRYPTNASELQQLLVLRDAGQAANDGSQTWLLFVDSARCLRVASGFHRTKRLDGALERWIEIFRNR